MAKGVMPDQAFTDIETDMNAAGFLTEQYGASEALSAGNVLRFLLAIALLVVGTGMAIKAADFGGEQVGGLWGLGTGHIKRKLEKGEIPFLRKRPEAQAA